LVKNKVVIITGAAGGIGSAAARRLGQAGAILILADIRKEPLAALEKELKNEGIEAQAVEHDVTDPESWRRLVDKVLKRYGRVDILVNNAGVVHPGAAETLPLPKIQQQVSVNFMGNIHGCRSVLPAMKEQGSGKIVNVASLGGIVPMPGEAVYSATKAAIRGYSFSLAAEVKGSGISVTTICPDSVETDQLRYELLHDEAVLSFIGEAMKPEKVAAAILRATGSKRPEILVPSGMGVFARSVMAFPRIFLAVAPTLKKIGSKNISKRRSKAGAGKRG
jgi:short-subunit dehydrogenase